MKCLTVCELIPDPEEGNICQHSEWENNKAFCPTDVTYWYWLDPLGKASCLLEVAFLIHFHYSDYIMGAIASQITSLTIVYWAVLSDADQRKHQSPASLAGNSPVNSPHEWPVTQKMFPFDYVIIRQEYIYKWNHSSVLEIYGPCQKQRRIAVLILFGHVIRSIANKHCLFYVMCFHLLIGIYKELKAKKWSWYRSLCFVSRLIFLILSMQT